MALQHAILTALRSGETSGYDLAKAFDVTVANFWAATPQQLYRELDKMQDAGLIAARTVEQEKRPTKRMYSLTEQGTAELRVFAAQTPKPIAIRDELLVQVEGLEPHTMDSVRTSVARKLETSRTKLATYERRRENLLAGENEATYLSTAEHLGPYLTLARGIAFETENVRWCEFVLHTLDERSPTH